jgi:uncharacterized protein YndB with AHSA1/START domain
VWEAITNPELVQQWFLTKVEVVKRPGGRIKLETGPEHVQAAGRILAWEPPRLFEYEWNTSERTRLFPGERSVIRWELTARDEGTFLVLTHRDLTKRTARVFAHGIPTFLDRLAALLDGRPLPGSVRHLEAIRGLVRGMD